MVNWLGEIVKNRKKNANDATDWILAQKDKVVKRILTKEIQDLIELSKNTEYTYNGDIITQSGKAFKNTMSEYELKILNKHDPLIQMQQADDSINKKLSK